MVDQVTKNRAKFALMYYPKESSKLMSLCQQFLDLKDDVERCHLNTFTETVLRQKMGECISSIWDSIREHPYLLDVKDYIFDIYTKE